MHKVLKSGYYPVIVTQLYEVARSIAHGNSGEAKQNRIAATMCF
jgi:hypothetical protein